MTTLILLIALQAAQSRPVVVTRDGKPVAGAEVRCGTSSASTDKDGRATLSIPPDGCTLLIRKEKLAQFSQPVTLGTSTIEVELQELPEVEEAVVVTATRTGRLAADQPLRVEVVNREEIEEKLLMTPGDIAMLLNETSGIRLQATSPALGAATVRVQGLTGRYTPVLTDGLPINGTQTAALGLLQIPPMDLRQVEVIKGAASALYGASALGGVINLVSRVPAPEHEAEALLNVTSRGGTDGVLWMSGPVQRRQFYSFLGGVHTQNAIDVDDDDWSDLPRYRRVIARPRYVAFDDRYSFEASASLVYEKRRGGTLDALEGDEHIQRADTFRRDLGVSYRRFRGTATMSARGSASFIRHDHGYGADVYRDRHSAQFAELSFTQSLAKHAFVAGVALDRQTFTASETAAFDYNWTTPGVFVQDDWVIHPRWSVSGSARIDRHPEFGTFASPRISSLVRFGGLDARLSYGTGFYASTPLTEEADEVGLRFVSVPAKLQAEEGRTWSLDLSRRIGIVDVSVSAFGSRIEHAVGAETIGDRVVLFNRDGLTRTSGAEVFGRFRHGPWVVTASHAWTRATEVERDGQRVAVPLTPRRTASVVGAWERHGVARIGFEVYRTGRQRLDENPYATESVAYTIVGLLAERTLGRVRAFVNFENLTNVRLSKTHPLLRPSPTLTGRWTVDAWAPLEGRTVNGGVRITF